MSERAAEAVLYFENCMIVVNSFITYLSATSLSVIYNMTTAFIRSGATRLVSPKEQGRPT